MGGSPCGLSLNSIAIVNVHSGGSGESEVISVERRAKIARNWECRSIRGVGGVGGWETGSGGSCGEEGGDD